ncbi:diguanylate cyclase [Nitratiruptor sp. YY08-26]|uniref:GGDEF domain-containing protein n=1 Tax=unclassified Nitratiruptor TaxID=2624044 RepID=UPI001915E9D1|nr:MULTISPECIES: GGDEF domain-containing protein [unclassified Nitratiruptor]BCD61876.1 diguanylate cyclase [Nitratiruptor sp. YY08-13]BCD65811.1 diguanylate cyclase [Nitratiruptor sp. YY08-26]
MKKNSFIRILFFLIVYVTLSAIATYYFSIDKRERTKLYLAQQIEKLYSEYQATKYAYRMLANFFYDELSHNTKFLQLLVSWQKDSKVGKEIEKVLSQKFRLLQKYEINYLTIYDPSGNIVASMHKIAPIKRKKSKLFEKKETTNELVIEFKKPFYFQRNMVGIYKAAISYNVFKNRLAKLFKGYYEYIINGTLINKKVFSYGNYLFVQSDLHKDFYYEQSSKSLQNSRQKELIHRINSTIKEKIASSLAKRKNFAILTKIDDTYYTVSFLAIKGKEHIGYLISYKPDSNAAIFETIFWQNVILSNIIIAIVLLFIYYVLETRTRFEMMAVTDKLTKLYNRYKFYSIAEQEIQRAKRHKRPFAIIMFDIDKFKLINDTYGHDIGDLVLKEISQIIRKNIRRYDYAFRWGGEEFIILAPETDIKNAMKLAEKIRKLVENHSFEEVGKVTISLGVTQFDPENEDNIDAAIKRADNALYLSKKEGRNRVTLAV